jgi:hypothetical protein
VNLTDGLSGQGGLEGVRWLLRGRPARLVVRRELAALLEDGHTLGPCRLRRAKFKPGRKLTAYYDTELRDRNGSPDRSRPVAVTWTPDGDGHGDPARASAELQAEAARRGLATPFQALETGHPAWGMRILVSPLDERFPQLGRLSDPGYLADLLPSRIVAVTPIRYRPGQRHVLRYDLRAPGCVFAKLYEDDQGRHSYDVAVRVAEWLGSSGDGLAAARPLAYLADDRAVLYRHVAGRPLSELRGVRASNELHLRRAGSLLRTLHDAPAALGDGLSQHDLPAEVRATARAAEHVDTLLPATGAKIHEILERAQAVYERLPQEAPTFTHGDFKADHLWAAQGLLTLIDFDRCCVADPASDLGKLLADQHWWYRAGDLEQAQQHFLHGYGEGASGARLARARVYEAMLLAKIAVRRVRLFDPDWPGRTETLVDRAEAVLAGAEGGPLH